MGLIANWVKRNKIADLKPGDRDAYRVAVEHLEDTDRQTRLHAIQAIARIDPDAARPVLRRIAQREDIWDRRIAMTVMRRTTGRELWPTLLEAARDPDKSVAFEAYIGLRDLAGPGDLAELYGLADELRPKPGRRMRLMAERVERRATRS